MNDFKQVISLKRKQLNMTQKELADKINVSDKLVSKWERGMSYPDLTMIHTLAKALNIDIKELLMLPEFINPKEEGTFNQANIARFSIKYMIAVVISILGLFILLISTINDIDNILRIILIILGVIMLATGTIIHLIANIQFKEYFVNQKNVCGNYQQVYVKKNFIYLDIFLFSSTLLLLMVSFGGNSIIVVNIGIICAVLMLIIYGFKEITAYRMKQTFKQKYLNWIVFFLNIIIVISLLGNIVINSWLYNQWAMKGEQILWDLIGVHWSSKLLVAINANASILIILNSGLIYFRNSSHIKIEKMSY